MNHNRYLVVKYYRTMLVVKHYWTRLTDGEIQKLDLIQDDGRKPRRGVLKYHRGIHYCVLSRSLVEVKYSYGQNPYIVIQ